MTQVKICGLTRPRDVELACELGASYVGFNFAAVSPRRVTVGSARELSRCVSPGVIRVGVFVEETLGEVRAAIEAACLDLVQIHRPLRQSDLDLPRPVITVARVRNGSAGLPAPELLAPCRLILLDAEAPGQPGGTGRPLDWEAISARDWPRPLMLAGGLTPDNVEEAIARVRPAAVDVASGVESSPGVKEETRMRRFFEAVARSGAQP